MQGQTYAFQAVCGHYWFWPRLKSVTRLETALYAGDPLEKLLGSRPAHKWSIYWGYHALGYRWPVFTYCQKHVLLRILNNFFSIKVFNNMGRVLPRQLPRLSSILATGLRRERMGKVLCSFALLNKVKRKLNLKCSQNSFWHNWSQLRKYDQFQALFFLILKIR